MKRLLCFLMIICFLACKKNAGENLGLPEITSFAAHVDTIGATVTIYGLNFSKTTSNNKVIFNTAEATPFFSANDSLRVVLPVGATTGKIQVNVYSKNAISKDSFYVVTGRWKKMADFVGGQREDAIGFSIGAKGYISMGTGDQNYPDLWEYTTGPDGWSRRADFPGLPLDGAISFTIQGIAYVGFGSSNIFPYSSLAFYSYDPQTNNWVRRADPPSLGTSYLNPVGLAINGKGYVITNSSNLFEYDPALDQWTVKTGYPGGDRIRPTGFAIGTKGYLVGGAVGNNMAGVQDCWEYDALADTWTKKASVGSEMYNAVGFTINGKGYAGNDFFYGPVFWEYDPATDHWTMKSHFPGLAHGYAVSFVINDTAYVSTGGYSNTVTAEVWRFVP